jgi:hypothetical protein
LNEVWADSKIILAFTRAAIRTFERVDRYLGELVQVDGRLSDYLATLSQQKREKGRPG